MEDQAGDKNWYSYPLSVMYVCPVTCGKSEKKKEKNISSYPHQYYV